MQQERGGKERGAPARCVTVHQRVAPDSARLLHWSRLLPVFGLWRLIHLPVQHFHLIFRFLYFLKEFNFLLRIVGPLQHLVRGRQAVVCFLVKGIGCGGGKQVRRCLLRLLPLHQQPRQTQLRFDFSGIELVGLAVVQIGLVGIRTQAGNAAEFAFDAGTVSVAGNGVLQFALRRILRGRIAAQTLKSPRSVRSGLPVGADRSPKPCGDVPLHRSGRRH